MKKRKISTTIAAIVLAFGVMSTSVAAATSYCQFMVGDKLCGCPVSLRFTGHSKEEDGSHKYGGFLGIGAKDCYYKYYYGYYNEECSQGHVSSVRQVKVDYSHTACGK